MPGDVPQQPDWSIRLEGQEYGPVTAQKLDELCRAGVIRVDTRVLGPFMRRWTEAGMVEALRAELVRIPAMPTVQAQLLRDIPAVAIRRPWFELPRLGIEASAWTIGSLALAATAVGALRWTNYVSGENTFAQLAKALGVVIGTFASGLLIGFLGMLFGCFCSLKRPRWVAVTGFNVAAGLVVLCAAIAQLSALAHEEDVRVKTNAAAQRQIEDARASVERIVVIPKAALTLPATQPVAKAPPRDFARDKALVQAAMQGIRDDAGAARERYLAAVRAMDVKRTLDASQLADASTYGAARQRLRGAASALATMEAEVHKVLDAAPARLAASGASSEAERQALASFAPMRERTEKTLLALTQFERQIFSDVGVILELARSRAGKTSAVDGRLVFFSSPDGAIYRRKMDDIKSIAKQERNLMRTDRTSDPDPATSLAGIVATAE